MGWFKRKRKNRRTALPADFWGKPTVCTGRLVDLGRSDSVSITDQYLSEALDATAGAWQSLLKLMACDDIGLLDLRDGFNALGELRETLRELADVRVGALGGVHEVDTCEACLLCRVDSNHSSSSVDGCANSLEAEASSSATAEPTGEEPLPRENGGA